MLQDYKDFVLKTNTLALAIGVIIGGATSKIVSSIVQDLFMPLISLIVPQGEWSTAEFVLHQSISPSGRVVVDAVKYGHFISVVIDFLVISFVVFFMTKFLGFKHNEATNKECPECLEQIPIKAKKCRACCTELVSS